MVCRDLQEVTTFLLKETPRPVSWENNKVDEVEEMGVVVSFCVPLP